MDKRDAEESDPERIRTFFRMIAKWPVRAFGWTLNARTTL